MRRVFDFRKGTSDSGRVTVVSRMLSWISAVRTRVNQPRVRRYSLGAAALLLLGGLALSVINLPAHVGLVRPWLLLMSAGLGVPVAILLTVVETRLSARVLYVDFDWPTSLRISLLASAANMLPLPGGPLVRVSSLTGAGAGLRASTAATLLIALLWIALATLGAAAGASDDSRAAGAWLAIGGGVIGFFAAGGLYTLSRSMALVLMTVLAKAAAVVVDVLRIYWVLGALGVEATLRQTAVFSLSGVAGAAVSIVPSGLGINEVVAAAIAPLADVASSTAFLATAVNRIAALAVLLPLVAALTIGVRQTTHQRTD